MADSRIPAEKVEAAQAWAIPEVRDGQIVQSEKLRQRGTRGELINVDKKEVIYNNITAGQLEDIHRQAYKEVFDQGFAEGRLQGQKKGLTEGLAEGQKQIQQHSQQLHSALESLMQFMQGHDDEVEQALVNLVTSVTKHIIRRELSIDSTHVLSVVHDAVATLPITQEDIHIFLSEQDHKYLSEQQPLPEQWHLQADPSLTPGGCRVVTTQSVVDYTLEEQFQQVIGQLVEARFGELAAQASERDRDPSG